MHPKVALDLCSELLRSVLAFEAPADQVVANFFARHRVGSRDRHALAETTYAVLRRRLLWQHLARSGSGPIERRLAVLAWQGDAVALQAALSADEATWREHTLAFDPASLSEPLRHNLPDWIAEPLKAQLGSAEFLSLAAALDAPAPLDLRVNGMKAKRDEVMSTLQAEGASARATPYSPWGLRVEGKPALQRTLAFERGDFEVQDEGSQLLCLLTEARRNEMVVDFCAGAGGKTLALGAMMRNTGRLYAFDVSGHRLDALKPRLARSGLANVYPAQIAHERDERILRLAGKIDRVLVDAPCSGLGTLRRHPDLKWRQSPAILEALRATQTAILASAARLLKPGGRLVYATCSLLEAENEAIAEVFDEANAGFHRLDVAAILTRAHVPDSADLVTGGAMRLWPHRHGTDGFFAAVWQRR
jgi:16S rRNA (cytosine967-C5)-methyltransferase